MGTPGILSGLLMPNNFTLICCDLTNKTVKTDLYIFNRLMDDLALSGCGCIPSWFFLFKSAREKKMKTSVNNK